MKSLTIILAGLIFLFMSGDVFAASCGQFSTGGTGYNNWQSGQQQADRTTSMVYRGFTDYTVRSGQPSHVQDNARGWQNLYENRERSSIDYDRNRSNRRQMFR